MNNARESWGLGFLGQLVGRVFRRGKAPPSPGEDVKWTATPQSSNVAAIAFKHDLSGNQRHTLMVRFKAGGEYHYFGVPISVYVNFLSASSKGRFVWTDLRDRYAYQKVR